MDDSVLGDNYSSSAPLNNQGDCFVPIRAKYTGGVLKSLDKLGLNEGETLSIVIIEEKLPKSIANPVNEMKGKLNQRQRGNRRGNRSRLIIQQ